MRVLAALTPLLLSGCVTMLSPSQRQQLETKLYPASYERVFAASRDALINLNFAVDQSDYDGGLIMVSREILAKSPAKAAGFSLLCPVGDFYMGRFAWGLFDTLTWPYCIVWSVPANYLLASEKTKPMRGTLSLEKLGPDRTRLRVTFAGMPHDVRGYPLAIRGLHEEIDRQLFMREGDALSSATGPLSPQASIR